MELNNSSQNSSSRRPSMGVKVREKYSGSNEWWVFINHKGKTKSRKIGPRGLAEQVAEKIRAKLVLGQYTVDEPKTKSITFKEYSDLWLEDYVKCLSPSTYNRYRGILRNHILKQSLMIRYVVMLIHYLFQYHMQLQP